jgi:hypothetical protein
VWFEQPGNDAVAETYEAYGFEWSSEDAEVTETVELYGGL